MFFKHQATFASKRKMSAASPEHVMFSCPYGVNHISIFVCIASKIWILFRTKKGLLHLIFEGLSNLYWIISPINFFLFFCCLQEKIPNWRNYLFKLQNQAGRNTTNIQTPPDYSAATPKSLVKKFGLKMISALFLIAGIHSTTNLKTYEQAKKFFNSVNAQFSWE